MPVYVNVIVGEEGCFLRPDTPLDSKSEPYGFAACDIESFDTPMGDYYCTKCGKDYYELNERVVWISKRKEWQA